MTRFVAPCVLSALAVLGCGQRLALPAGQIRLQVTTDAPLPSGEVPPLFDRLRIDVYEPEATSPCADCTHEFPMDTSQFAFDTPSVGIVLPVGRAGYAARARLFRARDHVADEPPPSGTLDTTVALPPTATEGYVDISIFLKTDDVGVPRGAPGQPVAPDRGPAPRAVVGTWWGAVQTPCTGAPRMGEACVPGGASWMGSPRASDSGDLGAASEALRLVVRSPFFVDRTEVTVASLRASNPGSGVQPWAPNPAGVPTYHDFCTYTYKAMATGPSEDLPVNCLDWATARAHCVGRGGDLLSEAQYEALAGGLSSTLYVWGDDDPACGEAVYADGGAGYYSGADGDCRQPGTPGGALLAGSGARDTLALDGGAVLDLAGNLSEWAVDQWNREDEPCWSSPGVYIDPVCNQPSKADGADGRRVLGGHWLRPGPQLRAALRSWTQATNIGPWIGFRCARADH
jgi:formylglycine-generating enzyme required for sulfatase activity